MDWKSEITRNLIDGFLTIESPREMRVFLRDLLTEGEIEDLAKRLETARLLSMKVPYPSIRKATGFSTTTIARVSKWLQEGQGGYALILERLHHRSPTLPEHS